MARASLRATALAALCAVAPARAGDVLATPPSALAVTVYRAPQRAAGGLDLDDLAGFALVTETRHVSLPAGRSRVRFPGVADGIDAASAIVGGFAAGIVEKNLDGRLLSPAALIAAALGRHVTLLRVARSGGGRVAVPATVRSDAGDGVVLETADGIEALRCSGLNETLAFEDDGGLAATPTLSVHVDAPAPAELDVTLSYLAHGFDWSADYVGHWSEADGRLTLGAWVTLANGNGASFVNAATQVVAGRVNHENGAVEPVEVGRPILASCWPRGSTSDVPPALIAMRRFKGGLNDAPPPVAYAPAAAGVQEMMVTARRVVQEQLGDLKLYRVPEATTIAARQSKQVRLLDREGIPVEEVQVATLAVAGPGVPADRAHPLQVGRVLRTRNDSAHGLGLPLPSGSVAVFAERAAARVLVGEVPLVDTAVGEDVELAIGRAADVDARVRPALAGESRAYAWRAAVDGPGEDGPALVVDVANAKRVPLIFELGVALEDGLQLRAAAAAPQMKHGRPTFRFTVPANGRSRFGVAFTRPPAGRAHAGRAAPSGGASR